jgi:hypothetical protein
MIIVDLTRSPLMLIALHVLPQHGATSDRTLDAKVDHL